MFHTSFSQCTVLVLVEFCIKMEAGLHLYVILLLNMQFSVFTLTKYVVINNKTFRN